MDKRAWLRSKGFEVGERGRFSAEMIEALKEYNSGDAESVPVVSLDAVLNKSVSTVMRDATAFMAVTKDGLSVACGNCSICHDMVMYCACSDGPHPPRYLTDDLSEWYPVYSR